MSRVPPWFVRHLPQREAAFAAVRRFVDLEGLPVTPLSEGWDGKRLVVVHGTTPDGRSYGIGYEWTAEQLARYLPRRPPQPRFEEGGSWPTDVLVPLRTVHRG